MTAKYPNLMDLCIKLTRIKEIGSYFETMHKEFNTIVALMFLPALARGVRVNMEKPQLSFGNINLEVF